MAFWMNQVARGWLIYELTESAFQLGLVRGVQAIPILLLSPVAGTTAGSLSRKTQIFASQIVDGLMLVALALLIISGRIQPWHVYATAFGMAVVRTFQQPACAAMIAETVPSSHLTNAIGLNSVIFNVARSTGPALAGLLIAMFGTAGRISPKRCFIFWRLSGQHSFDPQCVLLPVFAVTSLMRFPWAKASSTAGILVGTTRPFAPAFSS